MNLTTFLKTLQKETAKKNSNVNNVADTIGIIKLRKPSNAIYLTPICPQKACNLIKFKWQKMQEENRTLKLDS